MAEKSRGDTPEKQKECFVIMPISDPEGYPKGHFKEVYSELIRPSVEEAGFNCTRADEVVSSNLIHLDVVMRVVNADLCICDLSSRNPNVLFEYGIRQAFDRPTVLIKDNITDRIFDISNFRDIEYDQTLRIGNILSARSLIKSAIEATMKGGTDDGQVFSLVKLLGLTQAAKLPAEGIDRETAQYQIIGKRLEAMQDMIQRLEMRTRNERNYSLSSRRRLEPVVRLVPDGSAIIELGDQELKFDDYPSLEKSVIFERLSKEAVSKLQGHLLPF
ncbi:MAG: hypothetical protein ACT6RL_11290 [Neoaquamicrobium sediminum]|uniref:hypothetical protein n=1 Tax=Neoaquamicrobium sediminum TaxID=1849104 RepID=UPI0040351A78